VFWHQRLLCFPTPTADFSPHLISQSRDGDLIASVARGMGCVPIRGSAAGERWRPCAGFSRGHERPRHRHHADGPLGPLHVFQVGAVYLASQTGLPIVPLSVSYGRCWRFKSWDRFILPWPFTWGVLHVGEAISVPPQLDAAGLETWRLRLETACGSTRTPRMRAPRSCTEPAVRTAISERPKRRLAGSHAVRGGQNGPVRFRLDVKARKRRTQREGRHGAAEARADRAHEHRRHVRDGGNRQGGPGDGGYRDPARPRSRCEPLRRGAPVRRGRGAPAAVDVVHPRPHLPGMQDRPAGPAMRRRRTYTGPWSGWEPIGSISTSCTLWASFTNWTSARRRAGRWKR